MVRHNNKFVFKLCIAFLVGMARTCRLTTKSNIKFIFDCSSNRIKIIRCRFMASLSHLDIDLNLKEIKYLFVDPESF